MQPTLFDMPARPEPYPITAGWKGTDTSREAAETVNTAIVRVMVEAWLLTHGPHTADEVADALGIDRLTVRPRCSELRRLGRLEDTGERRLNLSGRRAIVWRVMA